jgi:large subunit ribosomal protein L4
MAEKKTRKQAADGGAIAWKVMNLEGKEVGSVELNGAVFGAEINPALVHDTVRWQLARRRAGTHQALTRTMMEGGAKKPWKQKGTGRARAGSGISPLWVGGASIHGPLPRSYDYRLPKRTRRQALMSVLSDKVKSNQLLVVDDLTVKSGKTKDMVAALAKVGVGDKRVTIVLTNENATVARSARNIPNVHLATVAAVNVYDLLKNDLLVTTKAGIAALESRIAGEAA